MITGSTLYGTQYTWPPHVSIAAVLADCERRGVVRLQLACGDVFRRERGKWCLILTTKG